MNLDLSDFTSTVDPPLGVSVLIPAYGAEIFIEECLDSIQEQTYIRNNSPYEIIIGIDECEKTKEKVLEIREYYNNLKVFWFNNNYGSYTVRNTLAYKARYRYLIFFDADDLMADFLIDDSVDLLQRFDFARYMYMNFGSGSFVGKRSKIPAPGVFGVRENVFKSLGGFMNFRVAVDDEFRDRAQRLRYSTGVNVEKNTFFRRRHPNSMVGSKETGQGSAFRDDCVRRIRQQGLVKKVEPVFGQCKEI